MPEFFTDRIIRNLMPYPPLARTVAAVVSSTRPRIQLPPYVAPDQPFKTRIALPEGDRSPVFITARFRSGSTLLWQAFNALPDFTAYYEPLNERRWFDPLVRGQSVDKSHRGVSDYAANYEGLKRLERYFNAGWTTRKLAMGLVDRDEKMIAYIGELLAAASARPLLQFNRIDFRLAFLKQAFPSAHIIHLRRDVRDSWRSTLKNQSNNPNWNLLNFQPHCHFYLLPWYRDLSLSFPELLRSPDTTHPYEIHYLLHRLSILFARRDAHQFVSYEELNRDFTGTIINLIKNTGGLINGLDHLEAIHSPRQSGYDHTKDAELYTDIEARVEKDLIAWLECDDRAQ